MIGALRRCRSGRTSWSGRTIRNLMTCDEMRRIAASIAKQRGQASEVTGFAIGGAIGRHGEADPFRVVDTNGQSVGCAHFETRQVVVGRFADLRALRPEGSH